MSGFVPNMLFFHNDSLFKDIFIHPMRETEQLLSDDQSAIKIGKVCCISPFQNKLLNFSIILSLSKGKE